MSAPFAHEALFYAREAELLDGVVPFVREGLGAGEPVLVALPRDRLGAVRAAVSDAGERVSYVELDDVGRNPARILPVWHEFARGSGTAPCRGVGEPLWAGRDEHERGECHRHERLLNHAFRDRAGFRLLCPYDAGRLDPADVERACASHAHVTARGAREESTSYTGPDGLEALEGDLAGLDGTPAELSVTAPEQLAVLRAVVRRHALDSGLDQERTNDVVLGVDELASNSLTHGGGRARVRIWNRHGTLICEVSDRGHVADPLVGRIPPSLASVGGRGLWIVNQVCDLVELRSSAAGTTVRVRVSRRAAA